MSNKDTGKKDKNLWSDSIHLPNTEFPMRAQLPLKEPGIIEFWQKNNVYNTILNERKNNNSPSFILHDGPPYANGNFHVGHALNKILKDMINKFYLIQGYYVPYVPGWDCHGLPIELAAAKKLANKKKGEEKDPMLVRKACRKYAAEYIQIQANDQTRFGVLWDDNDIDKVGSPEQPTKENFYYSMSAQYEAGILKAFRDLFNAGYIYKGKKPVYWDTKAQTAMAEAEVEYEDHESPSIYVKFPITNPNEFSNFKNKPEFAVIWTTTPWTIPANLALCFNTSLKYSVYNTTQGNLLIADGLEGAFFAEMDFDFKEKEPFSEAHIKKISVNHPFLPRQSKVVFGSHVTLEAGTGIVHTAPGHGIDDYRVGLEYNLKPYSPVDHRGRYTSEFSQMEGKYVFDANDDIIELLKTNNALLKVTKITHSYPHSWRSHSPLIFRATPQWFMRIDEELKKTALNETNKVSWVPNWGQKRFQSMMENRPDWCLSRQRAWGVPIPAFQCNSCGVTHMTADSLEHIIERVEKEGIEIWFDQSEESLLPGNFQCPECDGKDFSKENDILDVWFDSGVSWYNVVKSNPLLSYPADMYLEGSDQHRGWFQSSLWPSLALEKKAPYKKVLTHGYVLDENGRAMSKSQGNVISPVKDIIPKYGADILRLWVSSEDYRTDNRISIDMMDLLSDSYRKIRNTFRYILGNLNDASKSNSINESLITEDIDLWVLHELSQLEKVLLKAYEDNEFHLVYQRLQRFCTVTLSNIYFDIIRDRLYCNESPKAKKETSVLSNQRNSALNTLKIILHNMVVWIAPVLSFTAEEIHQIIDPGNSVFHQKWPNTEKWSNDDISKKFKPIWKLKDEVNAFLEEARTAQKIRSSLEASVQLPQKTLQDLNISEKELAFYLVVSEVHNTTNGVIVVDKSRLDKCPRCWIYKESTEDGLCPRCASVVK